MTQCQVPPRPCLTRLTGFGALAYASPEGALLLKFGAPARAGLLHDMDHRYRYGSTDHENGDSYDAADTRARMVEGQEQPAGEARRIDESRRQELTDDTEYVVGAVGERAGN